MAGIADLALSALKKFGVDATGKSFTPEQREMLSFALGPQGYLLNKGIAGVANLAGYGDDYNTFQAVSKAQNKEISDYLRNRAADVLPDVIGDRIRTIPREVPEVPVGYFDQNIGDWVYPNEPVDPFANDRFDARADSLSMYNPESPTFMGPQTAYDTFNSSGLPDFQNLEDFGGFDNFAMPDLGGMDFSGMDFGNIGSNDFSTGNFDYDFSRGGQIYRGRR